MDGSLQRGLRQHAALVFSALTVALTFATLLLPLPRGVLPLLIVFVPTLVAVGMAAFEGDGALRQLLREAVRPPGWRWALIVLGAALALRLAVAGLGVALGYGPFRVGGLTPLLLVVLMLAFAEEVGWRGYALPRLLAKQPPLAASLLLGVPWALLHLALFAPGMLSEGQPALPYLATIVALSVLTTWAYLGGQRSVLAATLLHGAQNALVVLNAGLPTTPATRLMAGVYVAAAVAVVALGGAVWWARQQAARAPV